MAQASIICSFLRKKLLKKEQFFSINPLTIRPDCDIIMMLMKNKNLFYEHFFASIPNMRVIFTYAGSSDKVLERGW